MLDTSRKCQFWRENDAHELTSLSSFIIGSSFTMMNEAIKTDSDSLMALQALLKIRSHSIADSEETVVASTIGKNYINSLTFLGGAVEYEEPNENNRKRPAPPMKQLPHAGPPLSHVKPPFGALSPRSALSPTFTLNYKEMQPRSSTHVGAAPFSPVTQVEPVAVWSSKVSSLQVTMPSDGVANTIPANQDKTVNDDTTKPVVRTTEIEAALRSKPQRGRKRDNLSALERLELTRTRNREHAKTTR